MPNVEPAITKEEFDALPTNEKAKAIAREVLQMASAGAIVAPNPRHAYINALEDTSKTWRDIDLKEQRACYVCAIGASVFAMAKTGVLGDDYQSCACYELAYPVFGEKQCERIERAFEEGSRSMPLLCAIYQNILDNDGEFKPELLLPTQDKGGGK